MIDLNADLGEGTGNDQDLLRVVTSASIACGGHAGNTETMTTAVRAAMANGVQIGAHPGFADKENFGRLRLSLPVSEIVAQVVDQTEALSAVVQREGAVLSYIKLHGALANMAAEDTPLAEAIFAAVAAHFEGLKILALENSAQHRAARTLQLPVILEAYADRAYQADGLLVPRSTEGAVVHDPDLIVARCLRLARCGEIVAVDGTILPSEAQSICVHGDTPGALEIAQAVEKALRAAGFLAARSAKRELF